MKQFKLHHKIIAFLIAFAFVFQSMSQINSHSYTTGVFSYHYHCGCFGCFPSHLAVKCNESAIHIL